jgi:pyrroloquinoline quinone biosynthesis protein D
MTAEVGSTPSGSLESVPRLLPHAVLREDRVRGGWVVMGPERAWFLNGTGAEIARRIDGRRAVQEIAAELAQAFDAPAEGIAADIIELVETLRGKGLATW